MVSFRHLAVAWQRPDRGREIHHLVGPERALHIEPGETARERQPVQRDAAVVANVRRAVEVGFARKDRSGDCRQQRSEVAGEAACEDAAGPVPVERDGTGRIDCRAGLELQPAAKTVERALAAERKCNGRFARQSAELGHQSVRGFVERDVEGEGISLRHEGEGRLETAGEIRAGRVEIENEPFRGRAQLGIAGCRDIQSLPRMDWLSASECG